MGPPSVISFSHPPFPCCRVSSVRLSSLARVALLSSRHPLIPCHASRSFPHQFLTPRWACLSRFPSIYLVAFHHGASFCHPSLSSLPLPATPTIHHDFRAGPHVSPSSYSVVPDGSARSLPYPEMLSWPGRSQSQEAVIEEVEGG